MSLKIKIEVTNTADRKKRRVMIKLTTRVCSFDLQAIQRRQTHALMRFALSRPFGAAEPSRNFNFRCMHVGERYKENGNRIQRFYEKISTRHVFAMFSAEAGRFLNGVLGRLGGLSSFGEMA